MSKYRAEWLLTYVGGPILVLVGLALFTPSLLLSGLRNELVMDISCLILGGAHVLYGGHIIHAGRRKLREGPWRAEHFIP
jgi:hypothetical protein